MQLRCGFLRTSLFGNINILVPIHYSKMLSLLLKKKLLILIHLLEFHVYLHLVLTFFYFLHSQLQIKDACTINPCKNSGTCEVSKTDSRGFVCKCSTTGGFTGPVCEVSNQHIFCSLRSSKNVICVFHQTRGVKLINIYFILMNTEKQI